MPTAIKHLSINSICVRRAASVFTRVLGMSMICTLIAACGQESGSEVEAPEVAKPASPDAEPTAIQSSSPLPPSAPPTTPTDRVMVTIPGRAAESARAELMACHPTEDGVHATLDALSEMIDRVRCVNKAIDNAPSDPDWRIAYVIRSRLLSTAVSLVRALEAPNAPGSSSTAQQAQAALVGKERLSELKHTTHLLSVNAMRDVTHAVAEGVTGMLKARGLSLGDPMGEINSMNVRNRQLGVFEWDVKSVSNDGKLIIARALFDVKAMFVLDGYGLVMTDAEFVKSAHHDAQYDSLFEDECKVRLTVGSSSWTYPCRTYVAGLDGDAAANTAVFALEEALQKKASSPSR